MNFSAPNRTEAALSGARLAQFEKIFHEVPPRWRLKLKGKFKFYTAPFEAKSQEKSNQIRRAVSQIFHTPDIGYLARKPSITRVQIS
jgi:hypothetical protein